MYLLIFSIAITHLSENILLTANKTKLEYLNISWPNLPKNVALFHNRN